MPIDDALAQLGPSIKYPKIEPTSTSGSYIFLPENEYHGDLLISKERKYLGLNWHQAHEELAKENSLMLTIRQFIDFLNLLKSENVYDENKNKIPAEQYNSILEDILTQRDPYRAEWLDADFKVINNNLHINYNHKYINGKLTPQKSEPLEACLMEDVYVDLSSANKQGLPTKKSKSQEIYFYYPRSNNNSVARFRAYSVGVDLNCYVDPRGSNPGLGVRPVNKILPDKIENLN